MTLLGQKRAADAEKSPDSDHPKTLVVAEEGELVNASGHRDELKRQYGLWSICGLALTVDNAWVALGGSIAVSISKKSQVASLTKQVTLLQD